jgi:hypothetical protein
MALSDTQFDAASAPVSVDEQQEINQLLLMLHER